MRVDRQRAPSADAIYAQALIKLLSELEDACSIACTRNLSSESDRNMPVRQLVHRAGYGFPVLALP